MPLCIIMCMHNTYIIYVCVVQMRMALFNCTCMYIHTLSLCMFVCAYVPLRVFVRVCKL